MVVEHLDEAWWAAAGGRVACALCVGGRHDEKRRVADQGLAVVIEVVELLGDRWTRRLLVDGPEPAGRFLQASKGHGQRAWVRSPIEIDNLRAGGRPPPSPRLADPTSITTVAEFSTISPLD